MNTPEFTLLENSLRKPFLDMVKKYGKQKYTLWTIWTYMKWRSNGDFFTLPENLVREDLGIDINVLRAARAILVKEGWLKKDVLRDTGGEYLTRTWLVTAPPSVYHSLGMEPPRVFTTEGKSPTLVLVLTLVLVRLLLLPRVLLRLQILIRTPLPVAWVSLVKR